MLGVERHVPHAEPNGKGGECCAGVGQPITAEGAARVLGEGEHPQAGLREQCRQEPAEPGLRVAQGNRRDRRHVDRQLQTCREGDLRASRGGDEGNPLGASEGQLEESPGAERPEVEPHDLAQVAPARGGAVVGQFRIALGILRVAMMPGVVVAVEVEVVKAQQPGEPAERFIPARGGECGAVDALVHGGKHRDDYEPMQQQGGEQRGPAIEGEPDERPGDCQQAHMDGGPQPALGVGAVTEVADHGDVEDSPRQGRRPHIASVRRLSRCDRHAQSLPGTSTPEPAGSMPTPERRGRPRRHLSGSSGWGEGFQ